MCKSSIVCISVSAHASAACIIMCMLQIYIQKSRSGTKCIWANPGPVGLFVSLCHPSDLPVPIIYFWNRPWYVALYNLPITFILWIKHLDLSYSVVQLFLPSNNIDLKLPFPKQSFMNKLTITWHNFIQFCSLHIDMISLHFDLVNVGPHRLWLTSAVADQSTSIL